MGLKLATRSLFLLLLVLLCVHGADQEQRKDLTKQTQKNKQVKLHDTKGHIMLGNPKNDHNDDNHQRNEINTSNDSAVEDIPGGINVLRLHSMDAHINDENDVHDKANVLQHAIDDPVSISDKQDNDAHGGTHRDHVHDHIDPSLIVFFLIKDLKLGKTMPIHFPKRDPSSSPHLLPKEEAETFAFSLKELPNLLPLFSFSPNSPQAKAMENTLRECEADPIKGETKFCATSYESMTDFTRSVFGIKSQIKFLSTTHLTKSNTHFQNYTILENPEEISAYKMVACHTMPYPYAVFYCHTQASKNKVFKILLGGENGDKVEAVVVCHIDTSQWSRNHVSFRVLGIEAGTPGVCHFFPADHLVWISSPTSI
ncbi:unnamed protein product [Ilex paraguariensis]|uniref:BURP domain-containing protein n=1 Tax=Ilex paraguariensis TaxID=185542 RepID=A0ABC8RC72_9AQUA